MSREDLKELGVIYVKYALLSAVTLFPVLLAGAGPINDLATAKAAVTSIAIGLGVGVVRAVYGAIRSGELPFPNFGA